MPWGVASGVRGPGTSLPGMTKRAHVWISGAVQGVNFRYYTAERARRRGVSGWIRNLPDGRVEAVFEGDEESVRSLIDWCRTGPRLAEVADVEVAWEEPEGLDGFGPGY